MTIETLAAHHGVTPEDLAACVDELREHFGVTSEEVLEALARMDVLPQWPAFERGPLSSAA